MIPPNLTGGAPENHAASAREILTLVVQLKMAALKDTR